MNCFKRKREVVLRELPLGTPDRYGDVYSKDLVISACHMKKRCEDYQKLLRVAQAFRELAEQVDMIYVKEFDEVMKIYIEIM